MTSVYLGGLPKGISERELRGHLEIYGRLNALSITDKGFAFVEYESETDAKDVVKNFFGKPFMGYDIKIELAKKPRRKLPLPSYPHPVVDRDCVWGHSNDRPFVRFPVVVYNLNPRTCWQELKDFGRIAGGDPVYCDIDRSDRTRGYLEFYSEDAADQFVKAGNGKELLDNIVELHPLGRRKLRPEHGPPSRSPTLSHHRRHSSASVFTHSRREHSRSRSPASRQHNRSSRSPRRSPMMLHSLGRHDVGDRRRSYDDRQGDLYDSSPRHEQHDWHAYAHGTSTENIRLCTTGSVSDDYTDAYGERHAYADRMEAQWREYSNYSPSDSWASR